MTCFLSKCMRFRIICEAFAPETEFVSAMNRFGDLCGQQPLDTCGHICFWPAVLVAVALGYAASKQIAKKISPVTLYAFNRRFISDIPHFRLKTHYSLWYDWSGLCAIVFVANAGRTGCFLFVAGSNSSVGSPPQALRLICSRSRPCLPLCPDQVLKLKEHTTEMRFHMENEKKNGTKASTRYDT